MPRTLTGRLLKWHAVAVLGVLLALGLVVDRFLAGRVTESTLQTVRAILAAGFVLAALAGLAAVVAVTRERTRAVNRMRDEVASRVSELEQDRGAREAILAALQDGVVLFGPDGEVVYQNEAATRLLEGPVREARSLAPSALREVVQAAWTSSGVEVAELTAGSSARSFRVAARAIAGQGSVLLVIRDVTEAKRVESVRRDFVANASHELKTPVAGIQALAETIGSAAADDPEAVPRFAEQLEREARRLSRVIGDLLDLSRLEGEAGERTDVRFDRIAAEESERYRRRAERAGVSLDVSSDGAVNVRGSARDLALLVRNLVENAIQYTRHGGSVKVSVGVEDGSAVLVVRDSGLGIPAKDQSRIFERFYRVDRARSRETGGTGLGLSIVKHVAENHGGSVAVESELGRGSTFTVRLPVSG